MAAGWDKLDVTAQAMGINSPFDGNPAEVIGGLRVGVTPLEMADASTTLANGGVLIPTTIIDTVVFPDSSLRNFGNPRQTRVFPYDEAYAARACASRSSPAAPAPPPTTTAGRRQDRHRRQLRERLVPVWLGRRQRRRA
jgi:hypothetical protein